MDTAHTVRPGRPTRPTPAPLRVIRLPAAASAALVAVAAATAGGCYTTPRARASANALSVEVGKYKLEQHARVERLNAEYNDAFARLMESFAQASAASVKQGRDADAQRIADRLIASNDATLRQQFRDAFFKTVADQREQIRLADEAVAATRNAYLASYADLTIELGKLDKVQENLRQLAAEEDRSRSAVKFLRTLFKVYQDLRKKADEERAAAVAQAAADATAGGAPPPPTP